MESINRAGQSLRGNVMDRLRKCILIILVVALVPAVASATNLYSLYTDSNCDGWSAELSIVYRSTLFEVDAWYTVVLSDKNGDELETIHWEGILDRPEGSISYQTYHLYGEWSVFAPAGTYDVVISAGISFVDPWGQNVSQETTVADMFECDSVANEATTWSDLKSLYR